MKRLFLILLFTLMASGAGCSQQSLSFSRNGEGSSMSRPNILLIITDDHPATMMNPEIMPTLSALAAQSANFTKAYATTPLCCPSRSSILTGEYAHNHQVYSNRPPSGGFTVFEDAQTLPVWLEKAGYKTALFGKYLNGYGKQGGEVYIPPGWDTFKGLMDVLDEETSLYYNFTLSNHEDGETKGITTHGGGESDYLTDVLRDETVTFLDHAEADDDKPFFIYFAPFAPHAPAIPPPRYENALPDFAWEQAPSYNEADVSDKTGGLEGSELLTGRELQQTKRLPHLMAQSLLGVDDAVAKIMQTLEKNGEKENTIVIFVGDNGFQLGEHRLLGKATPYEESIHIPLFIWDTTQSGGNEDALALNIDLAPTILAYAGLDIPASVDGRSLVPIIRGEEQEWRKDFIAEGWEKNKVAPFTLLHTGDKVYIEFDSKEGTKVEFYDLIKDPYELTNVAEDPAYAQEVKTMKDRLAEEKDCKGSACW